MTLFLLTAASVYDESWETVNVNLKKNKREL